ncbi:hypothetical protein KCP76_15035 [Salmonella enterica subsp. enterica serovar Weltevreden]|nr:hypothetical protein KCP76_15035 [Salmonella enterica subsp. enterica serovar Weltevreden]
MPITAAVRHGASTAAQFPRQYSKPMNVRTSSVSTGRLLPAGQKTQVIPPA